MHVPVDPKREYRPSEIYQYGFILNTVGKPDYRYVLRLIEAGQLRARNTCRGKNKYYKVLGQDIITWKTGTYNIDKQLPAQPAKRKYERRPYPQAPVSNS